MCGLCGILSRRGHWTESASNPQAFASRSEPHTRGRERQSRTRLLNRVLAPYGLTVADWAGSAYILRSRTGQSAILNDLSELWPAADRLARRRCDPLDDALLTALAKQS